MAMKSVSEPATDAGAVPCAWRDIDPIIIAAASGSICFRMPSPIPVCDRGPGRDVPADFFRAEDVSQDAIAVVDARRVADTRRVVEVALVPPGSECRREALHSTRTFQVPLEPAGERRNQR